MLSCTNCTTPLDSHIVNTNVMMTCPTCNTFLRADAYPALFRPISKGDSGEKLMMEKDASCFYHPGKKAILPCDLCGRFLCSLCDIDFSNQHLCPLCLDSGKSKQKIQVLTNRRTNYDSISLYLALIPMLFFFLAHTDNSTFGYIYDDMVLEETDQYHSTYKISLHFGVYDCGYTDCRLDYAVYTLDLELIL